MKKIELIALSFICSALIAGTATAQTVTFGTLMKDMVNRDLLPEYPSPDYYLKQQGSYDRASTVKDGPGWYANDDNNQFLRVEKERGRTEFVMFDDKGPGAIVRFWMTFGGDNRGNGILRFYFDGNDKPEIEGSTFGIISGTELVDAYPLAASVSELTPLNERGNNLYLPLPYGKQCKVTYEPKETTLVNGRLIPANEIVYYNINYREYAPEMKVATFDLSQLDKNKTLIQNVSKQLTEKYRSSDNMKLSTVGFDAELAPGKSKSVDISGSRAIRQIGMKVSGEDQMQALRSTVLEIAFDGNKTVWVPVGEFFGVGYHQIYTSTWYTHSTKEGDMNAYWIMPFQNSCRITVHNYGEQPVSVKGTAKHGKWAWNNRSMYFGSDWHQYNKVETKLKDAEGNIIQEGQDLNFTTLEGKGVYVGDGINIFNTMPGAWWGEGDEKIYVDGEKFPSMFGTGTEDYYGYAWCSPAIFTDHPFIAQPEGRGSFEPTVSVNTRVRSLDAIPFHKSLTLDMEIRHWEYCEMSYAPVTFWYMLPGGKTMIEPDAEAVQAPVIRRRGQIISEGLINVPIESENMTVESITGGNVSYQSAGRWSNGSQIFWTGLKPGNKMTLSFRTGYTGEYNISLTATLARDYGTVNVYLNDNKIGSDINLYAPDIIVKTFDLGLAEVKSGVNTLTIEQVKNADNVPHTVFGFDRLTIKE